MRSTLPRLLGAAGAAGLVLAAGLATPAHAEDGFASTQFDATTLSVLPSPGKAMTLWVAGSNAKNPVVTIDPAGLTDKATLDTPSSCTAAADHKITCVFPTVPSLQDAVLLVFHATAHAAAGDTLHITVTMTTDNFGTSARTSEITVGDGVDLSASPYNTDNRSTPIHPGDRVSMEANVDNVGSRAVKGVRLTVLSDHSLVPDKYDNCEYTVQPNYTNKFVCDLPDAELNPGGPGLQIVDQDGKNLAFTVPADASGAAGAEFVFDALAEAPALPSQIQMVKPAHSGHVLTLRTRVSSQSVAPPTDVDPTNNFGEVDWQLAGIHRDVAALGANALGKVGQTVTVNVGFVDNGPASLDDNRGGEPALMFVFLPPSNSDVVAVPQSCSSIVDSPDGTYQTPTRGAPHGTYYRCESGDFVPVGAVQTTKISLKITKATGTGGQVTFYDKYVDPQYKYHDDNAANDQADVTVAVAATLPVTGAPLGLIAALGAVIVAVGAGLLVLGRRGRRRA